MALLLPLLVVAVALWWLWHTVFAVRPARGRLAPQPYSWLGPLGPLACIAHLCVSTTLESVPWPWLFRYRLGSWLAWWSWHHDAFALDLGPKRRLVVVHDPDSLKYMLQTNFANYIRPEINTDVLNVFLGDGIFNSNGANWRMQRDAAHPFFRANHINEHMVDVFVHHTRVLCTKLDAHAQSGEPVEMQQLLSRFTLDTFLEVAFGLRISSLEQDVPFNGCFNRVITELTIREEIPVWPLLFWRRAPFDRDLATLNEFVGAIIREHKCLSRSELSQRKGLLSSFMLLESDPPLSDQFLRDITINFLLAGRDTTAQTLLWNTFFVSQSPAVEAQLLQELQRLQLNDIPTTSEELHRLKYHKQVLNETLRVLPPVPLEGRQAVADDVLPNGVFVPAGWIVAYLGPMYHRLKKLWGADADLYNPDRWSSERKDSVRPYQFLAFHGGEQRCLGQVMAYQEMKVALAAMTARYSFELAMPPKDVVATRGLTVYAKHGLRFTVRPRSAVPLQTLLDRGAAPYDLSKRDRFYWKDD